MKEKGKRFNQGKVPLSYVLQSKESSEGLARVLEMGGKKYGRDNWKKGLNENEIIDSLMRHLVKHINGEIFDDESGLPHTDHIQANAYFLSHFTHRQIKLKGESNE